MNVYIYINTFLVGWLVGVLVGFYGVSTFVGYFMPKQIFMQIVLFQAIQFCISTQFNCQNHFYFKLFSLFKPF